MLARITIEYLIGTASHFVGARAAIDRADVVVDQYLSQEQLQRPLVLVRQVNQCGEVAVPVVNAVVQTYNAYYRYRQRQDYSKQYAYRRAAVYLRRFLKLKRYRRHEERAHDNHVVCRDARNQYYRPPTVFKSQGLSNHQVGRDKSAAKEHRYRAVNHDTVAPP